MTEEVMRPSPREPFPHGEKVIHNGMVWDVIEDRVKNITLRLGEHNYKTVLPSELEAIKKENQ